MTAKGRLYTFNHHTTEGPDPHPEHSSRSTSSHGSGNTADTANADTAANSDTNGFKVDKVVDTVGAGDGFAAGVITALMEGLPLKEAVRRGNAIGAIQVTSRGDNEGLPYPDQLKAFMEK